MDPASIFPVSVSMIHLGLAIFQKTFPEFRNAIGHPDVQVKSVELMIDILTRFLKIQLIALDLIRGPDEQFEIFGHFAFNTYTKVNKCAGLYRSSYEIFTQFITSDICVDNQQIFIVSIDRCTYRKKIFL
jgi:hypothetical protein